MWGRQGRILCARRCPGGASEGLAGTPRNEMRVEERNQVTSEKGASISAA